MRLLLVDLFWLAVSLLYKRHGNLKGAATNRRYEGIKRSVKGNKTKAAKIANAGKTFAARSRMAKKGWRTRRRRGR